MKLIFITILCDELKYERIANNTMIRIHLEDYEKVDIPEIKIDDIMDYIESNNRRIENKKRIDRFFKYEFNGDEDKEWSMIGSKYFAAQSS